MPRRRACPGEQMSPKINTFDEQESLWSDHMGLNILCTSASQSPLQAVALYTPSPGTMTDLHSLKIPPPSTNVSLLALSPKTRSYLHRLSIPIDRNYRPWGHNRRDRVGTGTENFRIRTTGDDIRKLPFRSSGRISGNWRDDHRVLIWDLGYLFSESSGVDWQCILENVVGIVRLDVRKTHCPPDKYP